MIVPENDTLDILEGIGQHLAAAGLTPIIYGPITSAGGECYALTPYPVSDDEETGDRELGIQVRIRGESGAGIVGPLRAQSKILGLLSHLDPLTLPNGVVVSLMRRQSSAPLGGDSLGRVEISDNYYLRADRIGLTG